jgi:hypothetical protein
VIVPAFSIFNVRNRSAAIAATNKSRASIKFYALAIILDAVARLGRE